MDEKHRQIQAVDHTADVSSDNLDVPRTETDQPAISLQPRSFEGSGLFLLAAMMIANIANYAFQVFMGRALSPEEFGVLNSLLSFFILFALPVQSVTLAFARQTAAYLATEETDRIRLLCERGIARMLLVGLAVSAAFALLSRPIGLFLDIRSLPPLLVTAAASGLTILTPPFLGIVQGLHYFRWFGCALACGAIVRIIVAVIVTQIFATATMALCGSVASALSMIVLLFFVLKGTLRIGAASFETGTIKLRDLVLKYSGRSMIPLSLFTLLIVLDLLLVKHYFPGDEAGLYSLAVVLARILLYAPGAIATVLFPMASSKVAGRESRIQLLIKSVSFTILLAAAAGFVLYNFPHIFVMLFGSKYLPAIPYLQKLLPATFALAIIKTFVAYQLAEDKMGSAWIIGIAIVAESTLMYAYHDTLHEAITIVVAVATATLILVTLQTIILAYRLERTLRTSQT